MLAEDKQTITEGLEPYSASIFRLRFTPRLRALSADRLLCSQARQPSPFNRALGRLMKWTDVNTLCQAIRSFAIIHLRNRLDFGMDDMELYEELSSGETSKRSESRGPRQAEKSRPQPLERLASHPPCGRVHGVGSSALQMIAH